MSSRVCVCVNSALAPALTFTREKVAFAAQCNNVERPNVLTGAGKLNGLLHKRVEQQRSFVWLVHDFASMRWWLYAGVDRWLSLDVCVCVHVESMLGNTADPSFPSMTCTWYVVHRCAAVQRPQVRCNVFFRIGIYQEEPNEKQYEEWIKHSICWKLKYWQSHEPYRRRLFIAESSSMNHAECTLIAV